MQFATILLAYFIKSFTLNMTNQIKYDYQQIDLNPKDRPTLEFNVSREWILD